MQTEKDAETLGFLIMNLEDGEDPKMLTKGQHSSDHSETNRITLCEVKIAQ